MKFLIGIHDICISIHRYLSFICLIENEDIFNKSYICVSFDLKIFLLTIKVVGILSAN